MVELWLCNPKMSVRFTLEAPQVMTYTNSTPFSVVKINLPQKRSEFHIYVKMPEKILDEEIQNIVEDFKNYLIEKNNKI